MIDLFEGTISFPEAQEVLGTSRTRLNQVLNQASPSSPKGLSYQELVAALLVISHSFDKKVLPSKEFSQNVFEGVKGMTFGKVNPYYQFMTAFKIEDGYIYDGTTELSPLNPRPIFQNPNYEVPVVQTANKLLQRLRKYSSKRLSYVGNAYPLELSRY